MKNAPVFECVGMSAGPGVFLQDIHLRVEPGQFVSIVGPNGCGKTTLLHALTGLLPYHGDLRLNGLPVDKIPRREFARQVAVVSAAEPPTFGFTVSEFIESGTSSWNGIWKQMTSATSKAALEALDAVEGTHLSRRPITELSSGEFQRICIARALAQKTPTLILDEPTSHLDLGHQSLVFVLLKRLQSEFSKTILCVSHDINLASEYSDSMLMLSEGRIVAQGTPTEVLTLDRLESVYHASFRIDPDPVTQSPRLRVVSKTGTHHPYAP